MLLFSLLPMYLLGNLHCAGMCGPLVMLLSKHPHRWGYFLGRTLSFTVAGALAAEMGVVLFSFLSHYRISSIYSFCFGLWILLIGTSLFFKFRLPGSQWINKRGAKLSVRLSRWMANNSFSAVFLFGLSTLLLPCGQIIVVYSIIALHCTPVAGLIHGFLFALLTSPSLIAAMHASRFFKREHQRYHLWMGGATITIGLLTLLRGLADWGVIPHMAFTSADLHIALF